LQHSFILLLYARGLISPQSAPAAPLQNAVVTTVSYLLIGFMLRLATERIQFVVNQLRKDERELEIRNRELQDFSKSLEQRVADRTHDLKLASEIGRAVSEKVGDLTKMLTQSVDLIHSRYGLYYTQIYLVDPSGRNLVLRAGTGDVGIQLLRRSHRLPMSATSLNGRAASSQKPVLVADTQKSDSFLPNPLLPLTRSELAIPLIANDKVVGVLDMQSERPKKFSEANLPAFQVLAGQLAIAIENSALFKQTEEARLALEEHTRRLSASGWGEYLNAIDRSDNIGYVYRQEEVLPLVETQSPTFDNTLVVPIQITGANVGEVQLADETTRKWTTTEEEIVQAAMLHAAQHIENLRLLAQAEQYRSEAEQVSRRLTNEGWKEYLRTRKELADGYVYSQNQVQPLNGNGHNGAAPAWSYPLVVRDEPIGKLMFETKDDSETHATELVTAVIEQLSDHIEGLRLLEQAEQKRLELETVATVSSTASTVLDPDKLLQAVADLTKERFNLYHAHIYLANESWNTLLLSAGSGDIGRQMVAQEHAISMDTEQSLVARAARQHRSVIVNDVRNQPDFLPNPLMPETRAEMAVPMVVGDKVLGVFDVQSTRVDSFSNEDAAIYNTLASQVAIALQNARLYVEQAATVTQLRDLDRLKSSFLANMSHELRTPLNSILGFTDVMLEGLDGELTEYMDNDLRLIQKNGQHLLHLINDVLDMAKIESGRMNLHPEIFKVHSVLDEVVSITSTLASEKNLALFIDEASDREIEIYADNTRLRQVVINLVNNSIKFTEKGKISVGTKPIDGGRLLITVKDTGIGIPPDKLEAIFQEFTQVDTSTTRKVGGTGLGLPISRRLVEMHGGRLWAESTGIEGEGSTFYVELPVEARITEVIEKQEK
jgi:signal transduction histidine kinase